MLVVNKDCEDKMYSCDEAMELTGHGRYNYLVLVASCITSIAIGVDMFGFGVVVVASSCDLKLGIAETGVLASAPFTGLLFACPWGYFADTRGRRLALLVSLTASFILAILSSFSSSWKILMALKVLECTFSIGSITLVAFLGESTGNRHRNQYMFIINSFGLSSQVFVFVLAYLILPLDIYVSIPWLSLTFRSWRLFSLLMSVPLGAGALIMYFLQESPKFLAHMGKQEETLNVLKAIHKINYGGKTDYPVKRLLPTLKENQEKQSFWKIIVKQTVPMFQPPLLWRTLQLLYLLALCCSTNYVFSMWFPKMVNSFFTSFSQESETNFNFCDRVISNMTHNVEMKSGVCSDKISNNTIYSGMVYGLFFMILNLCVSKVASWRRLVLMFIFLISAVSGVLVNLFKLPVLNIIAFTLLQGTSVGIGIVCSYFVDLYPTGYRSLVTCLGTTVSRLASFAGVNLVGAVILNYCSLTFYSWSLFVLSGIGVALFLPSDKSKIQHP